MSTEFRVILLAVICSVLTVLVRERSGVMAVLLSIAACCALLLCSVRFFAPAVEFADRLRSLSGVSSTVTAPLMKITALGILTQMAGSLCEDAGENALAKTVNICGAVFSVYVALPLMSAVMDMLENMLGG